MITDGIMILKNGFVLGDDFKFNKRDVYFDGEHFSDVPSGDTFDASDCCIVPGLIDIHTHGAAGFDTMDATYDTVNTISCFMAKNGVTAFLPTLITQSRESMKKAAENVYNAKTKGVQGASIPGIYMEGPYFSEKYKGAQNDLHLRYADNTEFEEINQASGNLIKIISLAPELPGSIEFIKRVKSSVKTAIGHTDADYATAKTAIDCGASVITHTFNAMRPFHHRMPNVIGAAFDSSDVMCECICDGFHLSKSAVMLIYKMVGADRIVFISDSLRATGMASGTYDLGGQQFTVKDGKALLPDGTIAGSTAKLFDCVKVAISMGMPCEDAFKAASINPAKAAGIDDLYGSIKSGKRADLLILNKDLSLKSVICGGKIFSE